MAHLFETTVEDPGERLAPPARRPWLWAAGVAGLAIFGIALAFAWRAYDGGPLTLPSLLSGTGQTAAPPAVAAADKPVTLKDLQALQQQVAGPLQSNAQLLAAQQAELKRLSDQVSSLAAKVEALEHPPASAQASLPAAAPPSPAPAAARKKPAAPKSPPGISVGGAPLPPAPPAR
ncbi:MAG: hypothetical protein QOK01_2161 [Alphaproteobacteria bacterium]|nr:hypothetical protein [Alphaproteobacteria bacterium]